jgi:EAL domain-containing protein (putative c-di-GMP-specific phosphodiesterase class I)
LTDIEGSWVPWRRNRGPVPAGTLVAIAERSGLIEKIGAWVLEQSCRDRAQWLAEDPDQPLNLAVNVSRATTGQPQLRRRCCRDHHVERDGSDRIDLGSNRNLIIDDSDRSLDVLNQLKDLGLRIAMDDFGTGYSWLSYLRRLPIDIVKIDQGFIADISHPANGGTIVAAVTNLAHALGLIVVAEGVETRLQSAEVRRIGCDHAQGFYYAAPCTANEITTYLNNHAIPA